MSRRCYGPTPNRTASAAPQDGAALQDPNVSSPAAGRFLSPAARRQGRLGLPGQWYPADGMIYSDAPRDDRVGTPGARTRPTSARIDSPPYPPDPQAGALG